MQSLPGAGNPSPMLGQSAAFGKLHMNNRTPTCYPNIRDNQPTYLNLKLTEGLKSPRKCSDHHQHSHIKLSTA